MLRRSSVATLVFIVLLGVLGLAAAAAGADASTGALPKEKPIQPGAPVCTVGGPLDDGSCGEYSTLNFVFKGKHGRLYIGAVAHNFAAVGDPATIRGEAHPFGRVVVDDDSIDFLHPGDPVNPNGSDFALIRINRHWYGNVQPSVRFFGGPTGYTTAADTATGDAINAFGQGRPDLMNPTGPRSGQLVADSQRAFSSSVPESGGDSGMPYVHAPTGKALGVNANCFCGLGAPGLYPTVEFILKRLKVLGVQVKLVRSGYVP